ncbi:MAG: hypothetical protein ACOC2C_04805, partial [Cyclonatronaceae bacterium]
MKTLYYSLRKVSQLTGLSPELIKKLQEEVPEKLTPADTAAGNPLYTPGQVELMKKLGGKYLNLPAPEKAADGETDTPPPPAESPEKKPETTRPPASEFIRPEKRSRHLHPLHRKPGKETPPHPLFKAGSPAASPDAKNPGAARSSAGGTSGEHKETPGARNFSDKKDRPQTTKPDASYKFRAAISNLKSYRRSAENA